MKAKCIFALALLTSILCFVAAAQHRHDPQTKDEAKSRKVSEMMGKPTFEQSIEGINLQVWLITQEEHKKMMKDHMGSHQDKSEMKDMEHGMMHGKGRMGMMHGKKDDGQEHHMMGAGAKHDGKGMDHKAEPEAHQTPDEMDAMMAGTHHVMVVATNEAGKEEIDMAKVEVQLTSPSRKGVVQELTSMMNHFGGGLDLEEEGEYILTLHVKVGDRICSADFHYEVH